MHFCIFTNMEHSNTRTHANRPMADSQALGDVVTIRLPEGDRVRHRIEAAKDDESRSDRLRRLIRKGEAAERDAKREEKRAA